MVLFVVTGQAPAILVVALVILVYLTWVDLRQMDQPVLVKAWWLLLVFLLNLLGYLGFRIWLAAQRGRRA